LSNAKIKLKRKHKWLPVSAAGPSVKPGSLRDQQEFEEARSGKDSKFPKRSFPFLTLSTVLPTPVTASNDRQSFHSGW
jgi:hypothetical protein